MYDNLFSKMKKKKVYQWELSIVQNWTIDEIRNRIWMAKELGQSIPSCVSVESLRVELLRRNETPNGYHENAEDVDVSNIEIVNDQAAVKRRRR